MKIIKTISIAFFLFATSVAFGSSILERYNSGGGVPKLRKMKQTDVVKMYRASKHASALDAQIRAYRNSAKENERVFSGKSAQKQKNPYIINVPSILFNKKL